MHRSTADGFSTVEAVIEGLEEYSGCQLRVLAKNENYIAQVVSNGEYRVVLACTPDLISIIDSDTGVCVCVCWHAFVRLCVCLFARMWGMCT